VVGGDVHIDAWRSKYHLVYFGLNDVKYCLYLLVFRDGCCERHCTNNLKACLTHTTQTVKCLLLVIYLFGLVYSTLAMMLWLQGYNMQ